MQIASVNVGSARRLDLGRRVVTTGIYKIPVEGPVHVGRLGIDGDVIVDHRHHGGADQAIYVYGSIDYEWWSRELGEEIGPGSFGENLTVEGLLEEHVCIGDHVRCGDVELVVTQPRMPCFKLGIRFGRADMVTRFQRSGRSGFYFAVVSEGEIGAGDALELVPSRGDRVSVADVARLYTEGSEDDGLVRRISRLPALPEEWRRYFRSRLPEADA